MIHSNLQITALGVKSSIYKYSIYELFPIHEYIYEYIYMNIYIYILRYKTSKRTGLRVRLLVPKPLCSFKKQVHGGIHCQLEQRNWLVREESRITGLTLI